MAIQPWRKGKIIRIDDHTPSTKRFWIEVPELTSFDFIPGQFITFDLPIHVVSLDLSEIKNRSIVESGMEIFVADKHGH